MAAPHDGPGGGHHLPADFPAVVRALALASRGLAVLEGVAIGLGLLSLVVLALWQSVARTLHMGILPSVSPAPEWTVGVLRHAVFVIGFAGAMFATYTARHLRVDAVTRLLGVRARLLFRVVGTLGALAVCAILVYWAWQFRLSVMDELGEPGAIFNAARGAMVLLVGVACMAFHFVVQLAIDLTYLISGREVPSWWIAEATHGGEVEILLEEKTDAPEMSP